MLKLSSCCRHRQKFTRQRSGISHLRKKTEDQWMVITWFVPPPWGYGQTTVFPCRRFLCDSRAWIHYVFQQLIYMDGWMSICPSGSLSHDHEGNISGTPWGNFFIFGTDYSRLTPTLRPSTCSDLDVQSEPWMWQIWGLILKIQQKTSLLFLFVWSMLLAFAAIY